MSLSITCGADAGAKSAGRQPGQPSGRTQVGWVQRAPDRAPTRSTRCAYGRMDPSALQANTLARTRDRVGAYPVARDARWDLEGRARSNERFLGVGATGTRLGRATGSKVLTCPGHAGYPLTLASTYKNRASARGGQRDRLGHLGAAGQQGRTMSPGV